MDGGHNEGLTSTHVESGSMTWTNNLMAFQNTFAQRAAIMLAGVIQSIKFAI